LYELGRFYSQQLTDEDLKKSIYYLNEAIRADPEFVPAYVALFEVSTSVLIEGSWEKRFDLQKNCARKLMTLAPNLGESHAALSWVKSGTNDWAGAEAEIKRAIQLNPNYAVAYGMYGCYMTWALGRVDEAHAMFKKAQELDPTSPMHATCAGFPFFAERQFAEAIAQFRKALELRPNCGWTRMWIGKAYEASGDYPAAIAEFEALDLRPGADEAKVKARYAALRQALAGAGARGYWQKMLELFQESQTKGLLEFDRYDLAGIYAQLGDKDRALAELEKDAPDQLNPWLLFEPCYDSLRGEPRFEKLAKKAGLKK
jgi:tetratricopeptide (TPR) repeat protein